jgi:hypothetical protein
MCPDRQIISLYLDGELPSPWREKMDAHLASCTKCQSQLAQYRKLSMVLKKDCIDEVPGNIQNRVWDKVNSGSISMTSGASRFSPFKYNNRIWERKISMPFPIAAAVVLVFMVISFYAIQSTQSQNLPQISVVSDHFIANSISEDVTDMLPLTDMNSVLQYLASRDSVNHVIIHLPETRNFSSQGEPAFLRAVDYSRSFSSR